MIAWLFKVFYEWIYKFESGLFKIKFCESFDICSKVKLLVTPNELKFEPPITSLKLLRFFKLFKLDIEETDGDFWLF